MIQFDNYFKDIFFTEENHQYLVDDKNLLSVTQFISKYKTDIFNDEFIQKYCLKYNYEFDYIKRLWEIQKQIGAIKGTEFHYYIESYIKYNLKNKHSDLIKKEVIQFHNFYDTIKQFEIIKVEYQVYDLVYGLAGTIDCILYDPEKQEYIILDWKSSKEIDNMCNDKMLPPFDKLDQTNYNIYSIQLSLYKLILERNIPDLKISQLKLVHFNNRIFDYKIYEANDISNLIRLYFKRGLLNVL